MHAKATLNYLEQNAAYRIAASSRRTGAHSIPTLKIMRMHDKRVIYPFDGCPDMPLFSDSEAARQFAQTYAAQLVVGDIAVPE